MDIKDKELHRIVITAVIYDKEYRFLITKRSLSKVVHPGKWTIPGGGLNVDDYIHLPPSKGKNGWANPLEATLRREVKEETGIEVGEPKFLLNFTFIRPDNIPVIVFLYHAPYVSGNVTVDKDSTEFAWVSASEAKTYDLIPGVLEDLEMVDDILRKK